MKMHRFARFWWLLGIAIVAVVGPAVGTAAVPEPNVGLKMDATPNPGVYGNILWGMTAAGKNDVWGVGVQATASSNNTLAIHWNGTSWSAVSTPNPAPDCEDGDILWGGQSLNGVAAVSPTDVWAVGGDCYGINTLIEHWDGTAWSMVASPRLRIGGGDAWATLYGVAAISSSNVWAVGYQSAGGIQPLVEHWDGHVWSVISGASPGGGMSYLTSVSATGPNDVWAVGGSDPESNLVEHWNGANWSVVSTPQPTRGSSLDSVTAISPTNAWAVGSQDGSTGAELTFVLHWNGTAWSEVPSPNPSTAGNARNQLRSVAAVSPDNVWAVGMYENEQTNIHQHRTLVLRWNGLGWSIVSSPQPGRTSQLTAATTIPGSRIFTAGLWSLYDRNIYDGHYTLPQTLVMHR
jgi:hypothetical protein